MTKKQLRLRRKLGEETNRMYRWEDHTKRRGKVFPYTLTCERTMLDLKLFAEEVWEKHGRAGWSCPVLKSWNGLYWKQYNSEFRGWSYQFGREIRLAKRHRNRMVVLHEITHALGFYTHGRGFARRYAQLLVEYGGLDPAWIEVSMGMYGIQIGSML